MTDLPRSHVRRAGRPAPPAARPGPPAARLLALLAALLLFAAAPRAQDATAPPATAAPADAPPPDDAPLAPDEVARVDGSPVALDAFQQYVGAAEARGEFARSVMTQVHDAWLVRHAAEAAGLRATPRRVDELVAALEARGGQSLAPLRADPEFEARLALLAEQVALMRRDEPRSLDEALDPAAQLAWLEAARAERPLREHELSDSVAASWEGGELSRRELGERMLEQLPAADRAGLLTEFLGVLLLHARARELGVEMSTEAAAEALAEREALVAANPSTQGISYAQILEQTQGLTTEELVASPRFAAEVLLREMVAARWSEAELEGFFEQERALFEERYGADVDFAGARHGVLQEVRRRSYQKLMAESKIVRRY